MNDATTDAGSFFAPIWRRKWFILALAVIVGAATYEYYRHQTPVYQAKTTLYLGSPSEQGGAAGGGGSKQLSTRAITDQVELINTTISERVKKRFRSEHKRALAKAKGKAAASSTSDFVTITTEAHKKKVAVAYANALAAAYIRTQHNRYVRTLESQIANAREQLRRIEPPPPAPGSKSKGKPQSATSTIQAANLEAKINQLETNLTTYTGVQQIGTAKARPQALSPTPKKDAIFGFLIGLIAASVLAYLLTRFDRRVRTFPGAEALFQTPVLAALPTVRSPTLRPGGKRAPAPALVEPLRRLNTALRLSHATPGRNGGPRALLFLSPDRGDGRSTLIANLARVQRESGQRVMVVEADFRRPTLGRLMDLPATRGLADVLAGTASPHVAAQSVDPTPLDGAPMSAPAAPGDGGAPTVVRAPAEGALSVLLAGAPVPNPPAVLASETMSWLLRSLADEYDQVLIDVPPPLEVSDALPLLPLVDGIVLVARSGHTRIASAERLMQLLERTVSAPTLGVVLNAVAQREMQRYGFSLGPAGASRWRPFAR